jgi:hypothetical protein
MLETDTKITPFAEAKSINEIYGDGKTTTATLHIPLTADTIGFYDRDDILEEANIPEDQKSLLKRLKDSFMHKVYSSAIKLGVKSKMSYSTDYEFFDISDEYIKEIRIKKVFLALDQCDALDVNCHKRTKNNPITLDFLKTFFFNISPIYQETNMDFLKEPFKTYRRKDFVKIQEQSAKAKELSFDGITNIANYEKENKVFDRRDFSLMSNQTKIVFKLLENQYHIAADFFKRPILQKYIETSVKSGKMIFVILRNNASISEFFKTIFELTANFEDVGIDNYKFCKKETCTWLNVNDVNLVPLLAKTPHLRFDTFLELDQLHYDDFKYNGYLELEVKLNVEL